MSCTVARVNGNNTSPLRAIREEAGLTREQVCELLDPPVSTKTLERWEKGTTPIKHRRMKQLALIYRVHPRELVKADGHSDAR